MHLDERIADLQETRSRLLRELDELEQSAIEQVRSEVTKSASFTTLVQSTLVANAANSRDTTRLKREIAWAEKQVLALLSNPSLGADAGQ
jgi:hypothetical protein